MSIILSVVMPIYNVERYLKSAIDSIISQEYFESIEILLINDGSTDDSTNICDRYSESYSNIFAYHIINGGVSTARNFGIKHAKGEYIHFMDSDDLITADMYKEFIGISNIEKPDIIIGGVERLSTLNNKGTVLVGPLITKCYVDYEIKELLKKSSTDDERWLLDYIWNKFFKRDIIIKNSLEFSKDISLGEDFEFNCKYLMNVSSMYLLNGVFYKYFIRNTGLVTAFHKEPWLIRKNLSKAHIELYEHWNCLDALTLDRIKRYEGQMAFSALRSINNSRCNLNKREKKNHLIGMIKSSEYENILYYCYYDGRIQEKLFFLLLKSKSIVLVEIIIILDYLYRKLCI